MAQLSSPGVSVSVIDESFYTPAAPGTVPLIVVASAEGKQNSAGTGTAPGTLKANAGTVYLLTSQKDLGDTFGTPIFKTDANNNPVHAGEQNEFGLQAAYSFLGVSNRAYVVRADVDLAQLDPTADAPSGEVADGTFWFDTSSTMFGIFEWNYSKQKFVNIEPIVITELTKVDTGAPKGSIGAIGDYAVVCLPESDADAVVWFKSATQGWTIVGGTDWQSDGGKVFQISKHTQVPQWKTTGGSDEAQGSVWVKITTPNLGAHYFVKRYNEATMSWVDQTSSIFANGREALATLDPSGGGINLAVGTTYVQYDVADDNTAQFSIYARNKSGASSLSQVSAFSAGSYSFVLNESVAGETAWHSSTAINFTMTGTPATDAEILASAIANAVDSGSGSMKNITVEIGTTNLVTIYHNAGGEIALTNLVGFTNKFGANPVATNWTRLITGDELAQISPTAPVDIPADGRLWYNSIIDEVDIMVHDGDTWVGYKNYFTGTDNFGPIVSASRPTVNNSGTTLAANDLWIDTSDLENFPRIHKWNANDQKWELVDNSDQTTEDGIIFADARWTAEGTDAVATASSIKDLLVSDFVDFDAPDPALYPQGMLLWNLRRSGFNVKKFVKDYVDTTGMNHRVNNELMTGYYPHRWVSVAANQEDGSGTFGRKAQRKVVVQALQALVNANQQIRDEESRIFNLLATPGYPELIGEMISLNYDRGLTAFIVGDTPARLTPDATSMANWGNNIAGALEDNDKGAVSFDEYLGMFYPWGYTSDNIGNNIAVPPSHMMLRTIALNDQVAYPWFAPAGTRRGGITNATAVGYITSEGEFQSVAFNTGQRDTLYDVKINPITFLTGVGLVNYGQKTRAKNASALDRINVARLVIYLRRQLSQLAKPYVFEPNDKITRDELKGAAESLLLELVGQRALYDYIVVCDTSNNTPARIDRNELYLDIAIEPVKAVEFIYIPLRLKNTGEIKGL